MFNDFRALPRSKETLAVLFWAFFCLLAFSYRLGEIPPYHTDESYYIESVKTMVASGDYVTPVYHEKKRFAKPILIYWAMAVPYKIFGFSLTAARSVSVFFGAACVWLIYYLARRLFGPVAAWNAALILPGFYIHILVTRWATTDMAMNFFILLAIYFFVRGFQEENERLWCYRLFYLSMGLGFLTKGPPALLIPCLAITVAGLLTREKISIKSLRLWSGGAIVLAVNLPWFSAMFMLHGEEYRSHLWGAEMRDRLINNAELSFYFVWVSIRYYLPWSLFFISALGVYFGFIRTGSAEPQNLKMIMWNRVKNRFQGLREKENLPLLFCISWFASCLILFTLLKIQHSRYMLPASPAMAMIIGCFLNQRLRRENFHRLWIKIPFYFSVGLYFLIGTGVAVGLFLYSSISPPPFRLTLLPLVIFLGAGSCVLFYIRKQSGLMIAGLAVTQLVFLASLTGDIIPHFNQHSMKNIAGEIRETGNRDERVALFNLDNYRAKLEVLTAHATYQVNDPDQLRRFASSGGKVYLVMRETDWKGEFQQEGWVLAKKEDLWKKIRWDAKTLKAIQQNGLAETLEEYREDAVLLTGGGL